MTRNAMLYCTVEMIFLFAKNRMVTASSRVLSSSSLCKDRSRKNWRIKCITTTTPIYTGGKMYYCTL